MIGGSRTSEGPEIPLESLIRSAGGLPAGFHQAAAELYARMSGFKNATGVDLDAVTRLLLEEEE